MVGTNNLLLLVLGLELLSLASYSLAGFHKGSRKSAEASMKYVLFGGTSTGVMLYGVSLLYGLTGTTRLDAIRAARNVLMSERPATPRAGGERLAIAVYRDRGLRGWCPRPVHFWTPDVYEGAPTPVTTFLAVASRRGLRCADRFPALSS
jgi:NADH-quinone oxidoreductase subunit N